MKRRISAIARSISTLVCVIALLAVSKASASIVNTAEVMSILSITASAGTASYQPERTAAYGSVWVANGQLRSFSVVNTSGGIATGSASNGWATATGWVNGDSLTAFATANLQTPPFANNYGFAVALTDIGGTLQVAANGPVQLHITGDLLFALSISSDDHQGISETQAVVEVFLGDQFPIIYVKDWASEVSHQETGLIKIDATATVNPGVYPLAFHTQTLSQEFATPEPSTLALLTSAAAVLGPLLRRNFLPR